jgi:hypothetical protein
MLIPLLWTSGRSKRMLSVLWVDWRREFMAAHPALFRIQTDEPQLSPGYPLCQAGWQDILERLCGRIEAALRANETSEFVRIRQKLGILRVSWDGEVSDDIRIRIMRALDLARSARSAGRKVDSAATAACFRRATPTTRLGPRCPSRPQDLSVSAARHGDHASEPGLGDGLSSAA